MKKIVILVSLAILCINFWAVSPMMAISLSFEQLNWFGTTTSTPDSSWGQVKIDYTGLSDVGYFNLNVNGNWVVQNLSVGSLYGVGVNQTFSTMFDLGVSNGTRVPNLNYYASIDMAPVSTFSIGSILTSSVESLDYQIGGIDGLDLGSPGAPITPTLTTSKVKQSGKLPKIDKFVNQEQEKNECVPGAISSSLKYLKATKRIADIPDGIDDVKKWVDWVGTEEGTRGTWPRKKKEYLEKHGMTVRNIQRPLTDEKMTDVINQLNDGQDVEMYFDKHAGTLVGLRIKDDGTVDFDWYDDNQKQKGADPMKTSTLMNYGGKLFIQGHELVGFVVECPAPKRPVPEPGTLLGFGLPILMVGLGKLRILRK